MADIAELGIKVDSKGVQQGAKDLKDLSGAAGEAEKKANAMGKAIGAAVAALSVGAIVNWTKETTRAIAELDRFARLSGTTAEEFQKVAYASARFGVEQEKLADILKDTNDKFGDFFQTGAGPLYTQIAATDNSEATQAADIEARLRKRRAGAAANVLTSATGIPSTSQLGGVAQ